MFSKKKTATDYLHININCEELKFCDSVKDNIEVLVDELKFLASKGVNIFPQMTKDSKANKCTIHLNHNSCKICTLFSEIHFNNKYSTATLTNQNRSSFSSQKGKYNQH